ncbi:DUF3618 domain-containing protein [Desulfonatronum thiodismutans]|uniref:DUF3618 domain-containing protein n=1 Tax=Desulfonatronum thiodismutans TaxID=159290 RepID=UPI0004ABE87B|nr:DUF3618 domain-containing protein [Desulfonatronum thiodismutans]
MDEKEHRGNTAVTNGERSSEEIRRDIARERENISQTVGQIGERIKEKMDWREYVNDSPYLSLGAAVGIGYLASSVFTKRASPLEQIMRPIAEEVCGSLGGRSPRADSPGLLKLTLVGIVARAAAGWLNEATLTEGAGGTGPHPRNGRGSTANPREDRDIRGENEQLTFKHS